MVGHTHQDFLVESGDGHERPVHLKSVNMSTIKDFCEERELFDLPGGWFRKVSMSYMDEHLDSLSDWESFIKPLIGINRLYILDDRTIINPIMARFADERNRRYLEQLKLSGIPVRIVK